MCLRDRPFRPGTDLAEHRQHLVANPVARVEWLGVGGIVPEGQPRLGHQAARQIAVHGNHRTDDRAAASSEPEQSPATGRGGEPVEHRLGEVGAGVAGGDPIEPSGAPQPLRGRVTSLPGHGLDVSRAQLRPVDLQLDAERRAELHAGFLVAVRVRAQAVVEMQSDHGIPTKRLDQARSRRGRIRPTGDEHDAPGALSDQAALPHRPGQGRQRLRLSHVSNLRNPLDDGPLRNSHNVRRARESGFALKDARLKTQAPR